VRAILVVVFEKVFSFRCPLDELPLFEFIQRVTNVASVPRMGDEEKEHLMKQVVRWEQPHHDNRQDQSSVHACSFGFSGL
jgi:hypothetical protein